MGRESLRSTAFIEICIFYNKISRSRIPIFNPLVKSMLLFLVRHLLCFSGQPCIHPHSESPLKISNSRNRAFPACWGWAVQTYWFRQSFGPMKFKLEGDSGNGRWIKLSIYPRISRKDEPKKIWKHHIVHVDFIFTIKISILHRISFYWYKMSNRWKSMSSLDFKH